MVDCTALLQLLLLLYCGALIASSSSGTEVNLKCSRDVPIGLDLALLPRADIIALSGGNDFPNLPVQNIASGTSSLWCANISDSEEDNYVNMTFTEPILLEGIRSFGGVILDVMTDHFVSNFSILYTLFPESSEPLQLYNRHFTATSPSLEYYIREAITARRLQFRINEYGSVDTLFCWGLFLLGCTLDNTDVITTSACPTISAAVTSSIAYITSSCPANINMTYLVTITSTFTVVQSSCDLAQFTSTTSISAIGGVAGLVLLVGVVMIVSAMILCIITLVNKRKRLSVDVINLEERRPTIVQLENHALYEREREGSMINNQLYKSFDEQHHTSTLYETVEETNDGSNMVNRMSDLDHSFQCRYTEIKVEPTSGVATNTENADDDAEHGPTDHKLAFEQANVPVSSDAAFYVSLPGTVPSDATVYASVHAVPSDATVYANVPVPRDKIPVHENIAYASSKQS